MPEAKVQPTQDPAGLSPEAYAKIAKDVGTEVAKAIAAERESRPAAAPPPRADDTIADVDDSQLVAAIEAGNHAETTRLLKQQRAASEQRIMRQVGSQLAVGAAALSQLAEDAVFGDPDAQLYKADITREIDNFRTANPGIVVTKGHWQTARDIVLGRHQKELRERDREAYIVVQDQGIGIPADDLPRVFTPFFQASNVDAARGGLGLGLYIAHGIVEAHGGRLEVSSEAGQGSAFTVVLPLLDEAELNARGGAKRAKRT